MPMAKINYVGSTTIQLTSIWDKWMGVLTKFILPLNEIRSSTLLGTGIERMKIPKAFCKLGSRLILSNQ